MGASGEGARAPAARRPAGHRRQGVRPHSTTAACAAGVASTDVGHAPHPRAPPPAPIDRGLAGGAPFASPRPGAPPASPRLRAALGSAASGLAGGCAARVAAAGRAALGSAARRFARVAAGQRGAARSCHQPSQHAASTTAGPPSCRRCGAPRPLPPGRRRWCCGRRSYCVTHHKLE